MHCKGEPSPLPTAEISIILPLFGASRMVKCSLSPTREVRMNRRFLLTLAFVAAFLAGGCTYTYQANVQPQAAYDIYSGYDDKVAGTWALSVGGEEKLRGEADMLTNSCSSHNFPFNYSTAFRDSVEATLSNLVENLDATSALPDSVLEEGGHVGLIRVQAERATAELEMKRGGVWTGKPRSDARITASIHEPISKLF